MEREDLAAVDVAARPMEAGVNVVNGLTVATRAGGSPAPRVMEKHVHHGVKAGTAHALPAKDVANDKVRANVGTVAHAPPRRWI